MDIAKEVSVGERFANGILIAQGGIKRYRNIEWCAHPEYTGVQIKTLISKEESNNVICALIVNIQPGCELKEHIHGDQWEMHEVIDGEGGATLGEETVEYCQGVISIMPKGVKHSVKAGPGGLTLLAKFF